MSFVDILIWAVLLGFAVKGFSRGLVREVCSLLGLVAGGWVAFRYSPFLAEAARPLIHLPYHVAVVLYFIFLFLLVGLLFFLIGHLLTVVFKIMLLGGINRVGGVLFGLLEGAFILCLTLNLGISKPMPAKMRGYLLRSPTANPFILTGREIIAGWESPVQPARPASAGR
ncbi:MAG TPA: CvpA family protein [Geobacteraceae bacterium]|nr:CvpA family protein [Geobacteraceae bacterium]